VHSRRCYGRLGNVFYISVSVAIDFRREDLANFPPEFTDEPVHLTPDDERVIEKIDQSEFEGFEYVNPLLMSLEDCV
jgi:hypothetical protein